MTSDFFMKVAPRESVPGLFDLLVGQFPRRVISLPIFRDHVPNVFAARPEPKVCRVDAKRRVATVANHHPLRDVALVDYERRAVRQICATAIFDLPVPPVVLPCVKNAAVITWQRASGQSLAQRIQKRRNARFKGCRRANPPAILLTPRIRRRRIEREKLLAMLTNQIVGRHSVILSQTGHGSKNGTNGLAHRTQITDAAGAAIDGDGSEGAQA